MELNENTILTIDPGVTSGFVLTILEVGEILVAPFQMKTNCYKMQTLLEKIMPKYIVCEDFEIRTTTAVGVELQSVKLIGVVEAWVESFGVMGDLPILKMQKAAQMKNGHFGWATSTKKVDIGAPKLKELGIYKPGDDWHHSMDAMRHFMQWYRFGAGSKFYNSELPFRMVQYD